MRARAECLPIPVPAPVTSATLLAFAMAWMSSSHFLRYTLRPTFSSRLGTATLPSVEAMMMVFPDEDGPNSFDRSTVMVRILPNMDISTFFISCPPHDSLAQRREGWGEKIARHS